MPGGRLTKRPEIIDGPQIGIDGGVTAQSRADCPGHTGIIGPGSEGVVGPFAKGRPDRVDGWQIEDVETHVGDITKLLGDVSEGAMACGVDGPRSWEQLIPGGESSPFPIDDDFVSSGPGGAGSVRESGGLVLQFLGEGCFETLGQLQTAITQCRCVLLESTGGLSPGASGRLGHQVRPDQEVGAHIDLGSDLLI